MSNEVFLELGDAVGHLLHIVLEILQEILVLWDLGNLELMFLDTKFGGFGHDLYDLCLFTKVIRHLRGTFDEGLVHILQESLVGLDLVDHILECKEFGHTP